MSEGTITAHQARDTSSGIHQSLPLVRLLDGKGADGFPDDSAAVILGRGEEGRCTELPAVPGRGITAARGKVIHVKSVAKTDS